MNTPKERVYLAAKSFVEAIELDMHFRDFVEAAGYQTEWNELCASVLAVETKL